MPNVRHVLVEGAGHAIHRDKPEAVLLALQALLGAASR
jgi:pimeloyl-ACP methyl ester carboxylesterase